MTALPICYVIPTVQTDIANLPGAFDQIATGLSVDFNHMLNEIYCDVKLNAFVSRCRFLCEV